MYADDIAIACGTIDQVKNVLQHLELNAWQFDLKMRKILLAGHVSQPRPVTTLNDYALKISLGVSTEMPQSVP